MSSGKKLGLPAEAMAFAKSMGVDLKGMEPEAEEIWKMLDTMSKNDPIQYENFLRQQYENAQSGEEDKTKSFRPTVGYSVKAQTKEGDGIKVREIKANSVTGKTLYINVCGSKYVDAPVDRNGNALSADRLSADGLSIPLVIGPSRDIEEGKHLAIDVIVNTMVVDVALQQAVFKKQITELAMEWVSKESSIKLLSSQWEDVASTYKGGLGADASAPVRFIVDDGEGSERKEKADQKSGTLLSPDVLLSSLKKEESEKDKLEPSIKIDNAVPFATNSTDAANAAKAAPKKSLIQEVHADGSITVASSLEPTPVPAVASQDTATKPPAAPVVPTPARSLPSSSEYKHMEALMEQVDGDFVSTSSKQAQEIAEQEELSRAVLGDLGRVLGGGGATTGPPSTAAVTDAKPKSVRIAITEEDDDEEELQKEEQEEVVLSAAAKLRMPTASSLVLANRSVEGSFINTHIEFRANSSNKFRWTFRLTVTGLSTTLPPEVVDLKIGSEEIVVNVPNQYVEGAQVQSGVSYVGVKWTRGMVLTGYVFDRESSVAVLRVNRGTLVVVVQCTLGSSR